MCIVIDMDVLSFIFNKDSSQHSDFKYVKYWIEKGKGFIVYGGTTYNNQLKQATKYLGIILELSKKGKTRKINKDLVDQNQREVDAIIRDPRCDDSHLIAIFRVSKCKLLCSNDRKSDTYIKNPSYYLVNQRPPKIYRNRQHRHLLCSANIVSIRNCI